MTVEELIKKLESMPQNVLVYSDGELADSVVLEICQENIYVDIKFKECTDIWCERCKNNHNCIKYLEEQERMNEEDE